MSNARNSQKSSKVFKTVATILRQWSYRYPWLYDAIAFVASVSVGGERRFRNLPLAALDLELGTRVLDMCCGSGQSTRFLVRASERVTGLDVSPKAIARAKCKVPQAAYVEGLAEKMPLPDASFEVVHTCAALHEMDPMQLRQIFQEVERVLVPGGTFVFADFHAPSNPLYRPAIALFLWLFETETAWQWLRADVGNLLADAGFTVEPPKYYAGGSLQVVRAKKAARILS